MMKQQGRIGILVGILLCLLVTSFLGQKLTSAASAQEADRIDERQATLRGRALTSLIEAALASQVVASSDEFADPSNEFGDPVETPAIPAIDLPALVRDFLAANPGCSGARVLKLSGAQLLVSTREGDVEGTRLAREEKAFFDLGKELQAGIDTNHDEGVFRKRELALEHGPEGLRVTTPYFEADSVAGIVELSFRPVPLALASPRVVSPLWIGIVLAIALGLLFLPALSQRPRLVAFLLCAPLFTALFFMNQGALDELQSGRLEIEKQLAQHYEGIAQGTMASAEKFAFAYVLPEENNWDSDAYRRPYHYFAPDGQLDQATIARDMAAIATPLRKSLWVTSALGLLAYFCFALGLAAHVGRTLYQNRSAYSYVAPAMIGMLILVFFPFLYGLALSFTGQTLYNTDKPLLDIWVGFDNYIAILSDWNVIKHTAEGWTINYQNFYWTAFITICWTVCNLAIGVTVGLGLAMCLNVKKFAECHIFGRKFDFKPLYRAVLVLPWALPTYVTALIWKGLFHKQFGPINQILQIFGVEPISWFDSVFTSFITGITVNGWLSFPFMMLISLGGLQSISSDMYEAARLDGASRIQQFRFITLPSLKPTLIPAIIISVVWTFNLFNVIYLVSAGEPAGANEILVTQAYKIAFEKYQYGYAAAYAAVIFIILLSYGVFQNKMSRATEDIRT